MRNKKNNDKILDVDASMQGSMVFKDAVNLRINGKFDGTLNTKGSLTIGENATVKADITGESITIAGEVTGDIKAKSGLRLVPPARVIGDIETPTLQVSEGAVLQGNCQMLTTGKTSVNRVADYLSTEEVAQYLDVDTSLVVKWVSSGRLPGIKEKNDWKFDRSKIDEWVANEKIK